MSMRELARQAGVEPATMTRLAKHLGFSGYGAVREIFSDAMRGGNLDFAHRADLQVANQKLNGDEALAAQMASSVSSQLAQFAKAGTLSQFTSAAEPIAAARRIFCLGLRSGFPMAWHFHYVVSMVRDGVVLVDGDGATGVDKLRHMIAEDVLLVISVRPYTSATLEIVKHAAERGLTIVAITDSEVSPIAERAHHLVLVDTGSPSFFHTMSPAFAAIEILTALVTGRGGANALSALRRTEDQLAAFQTHLNGKNHRRRS